MAKESTPEKDLVGDYKKQLSNNLFLWIKRRHLSVKILFGVVTLVIILFLTWMGYFGDKNQKLINYIIPPGDTSEIRKSANVDSLLNIVRQKEADSIRKADSMSKEDANRNANDNMNNIVQNNPSDKTNADNTDTPNARQNNEPLNTKPRIFSQLTFTVNGKPGKNKKTYNKGDEIVFFITVDQDCYFMFISIDAIGVHYFNKETSEEIIATQDKKLESFELNETEGLEAYYLITSHDLFNKTLIDKVVSAKQNLIKDLQFKGPEESAFSFKLPANMYLDHVYFYANYKPD